MYMAVWAILYMGIKISMQFAVLKGYVKIRLSADFKSYAQMICQNYVLLKKKRR